MVGAGVAGLACARELARSGRRVAILERARGVGGRCATRRLEGQPADTGPLFLHGADPDFLAALDDVGGARAEGWPRTVHGVGVPCHPGSLRDTERRTAFVEGLTAFPKHLAVGLDVRLDVTVTALEAADGAIGVRTPGAVLWAPDVVLTPPVPRAAALLASAGPSDPAVRGLVALLGTVRTEATLALVARYPTGAPLPPWDVWYPEDSDVLQAVAVDSTKRPPGASPTLVAQARPRWSAARVDADPATWAADLLGVLARRLGAWAGAPVATHPHRWRHARVDRSAVWPGPLLVPLRGGGRVALAGDGFAPGGGVEGAYLSGRAAAARLLENR